MIPSKRIRRKFDKTFKQHAVELWLNSGKAATEVAAELGIHAQRLSVWRENDYLRQQRDIFKKTLGILSEPPSNAFNGLTR